MQPIKILMVLASTNIGGAEMFVLNLIRNIDLSRFSVDLVASFPEKGVGIREEVKSYGCNIYYLPYFRVLNYLHYTRSWDKFLSEHHYDIIHGHASNSAAIYLRIAKKHKCATIVHSHSAGFRGNLLHRIVKSFLATKVTRVADYWFACSEKAAEHLFRKNYMSYEHYYTIPNAINVEKYFFSTETRNKIRQELHLTEGVFLCGHVGSMTGPKNHLFLLEVFQSVLLIKPNAILLLCGDGPLKPEIEEKALQLGIRERIVFRGVVRNVNEFMMAMDVLIFPSFFEGFPITVIEAEATGLPIVLSDVITKEVDITDCVIRESLSDSPEKWAETICGICIGDRSAYNDQISDTVFNMTKAVKFVETKYKDLFIENTRGFQD